MYEFIFRAEKINLYLRQKFISIVRCIEKAISNYGKAENLLERNEKYRNFRC